MHSINKIASTLVLHETLDIIAESLCSVIECDRVKIYIYEKRNNELWTKAKTGVINKKVVVPVDPKEIVGYVASTGKVLLLDDAYLDPRFN